MRTSTSRCRVGCDVDWHLASVLSSCVRIKSGARRQAIRTYVMERSRRIYKRRDQCNCANAGRVPLARDALRLAAVRWSQERYVSGASEPTTTLQQHLQLAHLARRDALDRYCKR